MSGHSFDRGGQDDGTLMVSIDKWYGDDYVTIDLIPGVTEAHLTAEQARTVAADLVTHAAYLDGRRGHLVVGQVLTGSDPEPPLGTIVQTEAGNERWIRMRDYWVTVDRDSDPESWRKVAGNYGPVTVRVWGWAEET